MKDTLKRIGKIISSAIFTILMLLIILIIAYILRIKYLESNDRLGEVKINFYTILTQSMYPTIKAGDIVITYKEDNNVYAPGDIITFISTSNVSNGVTITHKITDVSMLNGTYYYQTKGDNNNTVDPSPVPADNVIGRVIFRIPKAGFIQQFLVTKLGWLIVIVLPCLGIVIYDIMKIFKLAFKKKNKKLDDPRTLEAKKKLDEVINDEE